MTTTKFMPSEDTSNCQRWVRHGVSLRGYRDEEDKISALTVYGETDKARRQLYVTWEEL